MFTSTCIPAESNRSNIANVHGPADGDEHNPPAWPESVTIIKKDMTNEEVQKKLNGDPDDDSVKGKEDPTSADATPTHPPTFVPTKHFSDERKAIMFEPRKDPYQVDFQVGYYVQVLGLGASASGVTFTTSDDGKGLYGPYCPAYNHTYEPDGSTSDGCWGTSLDTFWRSAENFTNDTKKGLLWAVSQAAPLRRVHAMKDLNLNDGAAYASGGHLANAQGESTVCPLCIFEPSVHISNAHPLSSLNPYIRTVDGKLVFGPQQQFCSRSVTIGEEGSIVKGSWSNVYVDCKVPSNVDIANQPGTKTWQKTPDGLTQILYGASTTTHTPKVTVEKCFVAMESNDSDKFVLHVPKPRVRDGAAPLGADLSGENDETRPFEKVYVAKSSDGNVARMINKAFRQGKDVVLSPGIYELKESIQIGKKEGVLLGIGMATLVAPTNGAPCIQVRPHTEGVRVEGIMFEASKLSKGFFGPSKSSFIEFGKEGVSDPGNPDKPGVLSDIFCRVGGSNPDREVSTDVMVRIHSDNVLGDNLWLWRADHVKLSKKELPNFPDMGLEYHQTLLGEVPVKTGLEVTGNNVVIHGLAVEHCCEDQVIWKGDNGEVFFYQCELPYDVDQDFAAKNYAGFRVTGKNHTLGGAGVYSNFRDFNVIVKTGIVHPDAFDAEKVINPFTVHLNGQGRILTVVSDGTQLGGGPVYAPGLPDDKTPYPGKLGDPMVARFPALPLVVVVAANEKDAAMESGSTTSTSTSSLNTQ